ncbi:hypothetical protein [Kibdelosporangium phytohabitans]|uniref:hypothetical protein n=1 Tax=Kibdelosporangium phytohabitans TaxID=860235 RepID=UPI0012FA8873|nr:hypothetical protein [Kibdelosporangium phytohabitans]MBE1462075.1 hypothetical protein [Kibdelosporangium phytohabitans]
MRFKVAVGVGAALALALPAVLILWPGEDRRPAASLTVPSSNGCPDEPRRSATFTPAFILPGSPAPPPATTTATTTAGSAPPANPVTPPAAPPVATASGRISYYGARNNNPPGSREIAYTDVLHKQAGGSGTFEDPTTFAAGTDRYQPGTGIYVPDLRRTSSSRTSARTARAPRSSSGPGQPRLPGAPTASGHCPAPPPVSTRSVPRRTASRRR